MTLDEAIKHCLEVAEQNDTQAEKWQKEGGEQWGKTTVCRECAADHRQLAEWLMEYKELKNSIGAVKLNNMKEALELIREYKAENIAQKKMMAEYKRLLKAAVEDFNSIGRVLEGNDILCMKYIACKGCPFDGDNCNKWRYADEAERLLKGE